MESCPPASWVSVAVQPCVTVVAVVDIVVAAATGGTVLMRLMLRLKSIHLLGNWGESLTANDNQTNMKENVHRKMWWLPDKCQKLFALCSLLAPAHVADVVVAAPSGGTVVMFLLLMLLLKLLPVVPLSCAFFWRP